jgi:hypothetical protein
MRRFEFREDGPYDGEYKFYKTEDGVSIHIRYGQHLSHRFTNEPDYDEERNRTITDQYGWTVLCNDRAIIITDRSSKTGWDRFHTEFYGFVGFVSFQAADPGKLPWNTTKTDVDLNNSAYQMALVDMRRFSEKWRTLAGKRKKAAVAPRKVPPKKKTKKASTRKPKVSKPVTKDDHNQFRTVFPSDVNEQNCFDKHLTLVHEAKELDLADLTYSGLALIRMLFESTVVTYMERHGKFAEMKQFAVDRRREKINVSAEDEKKLMPSVDEMLPFLINNPAIWGAAKQNFLRHSAANMAKHQQTLNSALHNPYQIIGSPKAFDIRDEVLPLLRHLIET